MDKDNKILAICLTVKYSLAYIVCAVGILLYHNFA